jgi:DNA repair exonuclease SbcCD ATPase subunit
MTETAQLKNAITEYSSTEAALAELRKKYGSAKYDVTTSAGMTEAKKARAELRKCRTTLEDKRVEIKAPALERCKLIDAEAKRITAEIEALENPINEKIKAEEDRKEQEKEAAERARQALIAEAQRQCNELRNVVVQSVGQSVEAVAKLIGQVKAYNVPENEHSGDVETVREQTLRQLEGMHQRAVEQAADAKRLEADRAELDRLRAEAAKQQATADAAAAAERKKIEAEAQAARDKIAVEQRKAEQERQAADAAAAKARAEQDRLAAAERAKEEAKIRAERAKIDAERDAAEALARRKQDELAAKERAAKETAEAERVKKLGARALLEQFVATYGGMPEFQTIADVIATWLKTESVDATPAKAKKQARGAA